MLDVHPPHEAVHTWKDFFIHIATICIGLLIAIGLEQAVEALHRDHQRHTLQAELHQEALENQRIAAGDLRWMNVRLNWLLDFKATVDAVRDSHGKLKAIPPPNPPLPANALEDVDLGLTAWDTAGQSAHIELLPHDEALLYSKTYSMAQQELRQDVLTLQQVNIVFGYLINDHGDQSHFELSQLSERQLEDLSRGIATLFDYLQQQKDDMLQVVASLESLLKDQSSREEKEANFKAAIALYANPRSDAQASIFWGN